MMNKLLGAGLALALSAVAGAGLAQDKMKVGFVYVGPIGDHGWTYQHDQGRLALEDALGDQIETTFIENVAEGADAERVINQMAEAGMDMIFTTSFGFMNPTVKVAADFPDIRFEHATGYKRGDNVTTYLSTTYEGRYVSGFLAASVSETNVVGYIASFPIPEVIRDINAVMLGMQRVRPDMELKIVWVNTWFDPVTEAEAATVLIDQGADVIIQHTDSPAAMQIAEEKGIWAVGQASDMRAFGPNAHLVSVVNDWGPYYINQVQAVIDDKWGVRDYWGGMADDVIQLIGFNEKIPADVVAEAESIIAGIKDGSFHPFTGPINNQAGEEVLAAGQSFTNDELAGMNYYIEGIDAPFPK